MSQYQPSTKLVLDGMFTDMDGNGTNVAGSSLNIPPGRGTGTGAPAVISLLGPVVGSSGGTTQSLVQRMVLNGYKDGLTSGASVDVFKAAIGTTLQSATGSILLSYETNDGSDTAVIIKQYLWAAHQRAASYVGVVQLITGASLGSGTVSGSGNTAVLSHNSGDGNGNMTFNVTPTKQSGMGTLVISRLVFTIISHSQQAIILV